MGDVNESKGLSRRSLLKKSVVAGGLVWAAPTILSQPAWAAGCCTCTGGTIYSIKLDGNTTCVTPGTNPSPGNCLASAGCYAASGVGLCGNLIKPISFGSQCTEVDLASGVAVCTAYVKCANDCIYTAGQNLGPSPSNPGYTRYRFCCPTANLSHFELAVCVGGTVSP